MPQVRPLTKTMIETYLKSKGLVYLIDAEGDYRVEFQHDDECDCSLTVWLITDGTQKEIYCIRVYTDKRIPQRDWGKAVLLCNQWNKEYRWPKAYLYYKDTEAEFGDLLLEGQINLAQGIHQELFDDYTHTMIAFSFEFWKWARREKGL